MDFRIFDVHHHDSLYGIPLFVRKIPVVFLVVEQEHKKGFHRAVNGFKVKIIHHADDFSVHSTILNPFSERVLPSPGLYQSFIDDKGSTNIGE
jgi:hypothetical protein